MKQIVLRVILVLGVVLDGSDVWAQSWQNPAGGNFTDGANWSGGSAPTAASTVYFNTSAVYTVTVDQNVQTVNAIFNADGGATVTFAGGNSWTNTGWYFFDIGWTMPNRVVLTNVMARGSGPMRIGNYWATSSGSSLTILNGATMSAPYCWVSPYDALSLSNSVTVNGASAQLLIDSGFTLGGVGSDNSLLVTNGGKLSATASGAGWVVGGNVSSSNNLAVVSGAGSVWDCGGNNNDTLYFGQNSSYNILRVEDGGLLKCGLTRIGDGSTANSNQVLVNGGGSYSNRNWTAYIGISGANNNLTVSNGNFYTAGPLTVGYLGASNSLTVKQNGQVVSPGYGLALCDQATSVGNSALVDGSNAVCSFDGLAIGGGGSGASMTITNGGRVALNNDCVVGSAASSSNNVLVVGGAGSLLTVPRFLRVGNDGSMNQLRIGAGGAVSSPSAPHYIGYGAGSSFNQVTVADGGQWTCGWSTYVGPNATNNILTVTNGGYVRGNQFFVGYNATSVSNSIRVVDGGILDCDTYSINTSSSGSGNTINNVGGVFQFNNAAAGVNPGVAGSITLADGTISFRDINNADIRCNQAGQPFNTTKIVWAGKNGFRLNNATNITSSQAYTFTDTLGATNFARLELRNGSLYQGGAVTIGTNGTLAVAGGVNRIANDLTFATNATFSVDLSATNNYGALVAQDNVTLNGCALSVNLGSAPVPGTSYPIISHSAGQTSGSFGNRSLVQTVNGTNYILRVSTSASGATVTCSLLTQGMCLIID